MLIGTLFSFLGNGWALPPVYAQDLVLPAPGTRITLSPAFSPPILKGLKVHPDDPFRFDFILDKGDSSSAGQALKDESTKLIKYFLASLTIPEKDLWVNLSPYEADRIVPESFGRTEMGRDLLAQDYILKQITASLIYPEDEAGKKFWKRVYEEAVKKFGTTDIPVNTFNKVWIVPAKAVVYENAKAGTAYVVESRLKVMLEEDYLALQKQTINVTHSIGSQVVREIVIPQLTREINQGKNFAQLRQVYNSLILATWYKKKIKDGILNQVYSDRNKVSGVNIDDPREKQKIYERYLQAFKKGAYNYIKEEVDPVTQGIIPRKYFSGGMELSDKAMRVAMSVVHSFGAAQLPSDEIEVTAQMDPVPSSAAEKLIRDYEASGPHLLRAAVYEFAGVGDKNVYNSAIFQAKVHPGDDQETTIIAGRVENRTSELSEVMFFQQGPDGKWHPIKDAPVFKNSQDPSVKKIGDQLVMSMVRVEDRGEKLSNGLPRLVYYTDFFQFRTLQDLDPEARIARGPLWMKDIRLITLKDGHRILIMTRPQGDNYGGHYGPGKIGYLIVENFREFIELAQDGKEGSALAKMMENGRVLEGMFQEDQWGGTNALYLLENGKVGALGHIARFNEEGNREYFPMTFEFDPETGEFSPLKIIGRWETLAKLLDQDIPVKVLDPEKPLDLSNVWIGIDLVFSNGRYFLFGGVRDSRTVVAEMTAPFTSPIVTAIAGPDWSIVERSLDRAQTAFLKGGIDLTPANMDLQTKIDPRFSGNDNGGIKFHLDPAMLKQLKNAPGFVPVIINIQPMNDLRGFLGLKEDAQSSVKTG